MAKIVLSDQAPSGELIHFTLAGEEFDLGGSGKGSKKSYATDDHIVLSNAIANPWLTVEADPVDAEPPVTESTQVRPEDDAQGAFGPNRNLAFDPKEIAKVEDAKAEAAAGIAGYDANKDQDEPITTGPVAETVAADDEGDKD